MRSCARSQAKGGPRDRRQLCHARARRSANGLHSICVGPSISRQSQPHGLTPSKAFSPSSPTGASNVACSDPSPCPKHLEMEDSRRTNRSPLSKIVDISFVLWQPILLTAEIVEGYVAVQGPGSCESAFGIPALLRNRVWRQRKRGVEICANSLSLGSCSVGRQRAMLAHYDQYAPT